LIIFDKNWLILAALLTQKHQAEHQGQALLPAGWTSASKTH